MRTLMPLAFFSLLLALACGGGPGTQTFRVPAGSAVQCSNGNAGNIEASTILTVAYTGKDFPMTCTVTNGAQSGTIELSEPVDEVYCTGTLACMKK